MKNDIGNEIPHQQEGGESNIHEVNEMDSRGAAIALFQKAAGRLLSVDQWQRLSGDASATFCLTGENGLELRGKTKAGDYIKIDIPGPGTKTGEGFDWVHVEAIENFSDEEKDSEAVLVRVRPSAKPSDRENEHPAHFFKDNATSNFIVQRQGRTVTATILGRNEIPNTSTGNVVGNVRNYVVGATAKAGFSFIQWKLLVKGLIDKH